MSRPCGVVLCGAVGSTAILEEASAALAVLVDRTTELVRSLDDVHVPIPRSDWTTRDTAVHLAIGAGLYAKLAAGMPSPLQGRLSREVMSARSSQRIAETSEADPEKLARLIEEATQEFLETIAGRSGDQEVVWHGGLRIDLAALAGLLLSEQVLHGYDIASAIGRPWPIDPAHANLVLHGYGRCFGLFLDQERAGRLTAACRIDLRGGPSCVVRLVGGEYHLGQPGSAPVDCIVSADPVALMMVLAGRLDQWAAMALGLISCEGARADLAHELTRLFLVP